MIVNARWSSIKQLKYLGGIELNTLVGRPGHEIRLVGADGVVGPLVYAEGGAMVVWMNFSAEKSVPLPDTIRALLPVRPTTRRL